MLSIFFWALTQFCFLPFVELKYKKESKISGTFVMLEKHNKRSEHVRYSIFNWVSMKVEIHSLRFSTLLFVYAWYKSVNVFFFFAIEKTFQHFQHPIIE